MLKLKPSVGGSLTAADLHVHTKYSFDGDKNGDAEPVKIAEEAVRLGLKRIALCDHCDIDDILDGIYPPYPANEIKTAVEQVRERFADKIEILYGIELGQPHARPEESNKLLDEYNFDFVIGSLHNLKNYPDFCFLRYDVMTVEHIDMLVRRSIDELCEVVRFGRISTLAHINYIGRYMKKLNVSFDFMKYEQRWRELFHMLIEQGIALEVNASGLTADGGETMPNESLLALYRDCGGRLLTLGSDAHSCRKLANCFDRAAEMLRTLGFEI